MEYLSSFRLTSKRLFFRSFVSLFKYCDLCNDNTSHQLVLMQVHYSIFDYKINFDSGMMYVKVLYE